MNTIFTIIKASQTTQHTWDTFLYKIIWQYEQKPLLEKVFCTKSWALLNLNM